MKVVRNSLLFKNIIRQNFKNWVQTLLMIGLILISSLLFMLVLFSNKTLTDAENETNRISNLHDFVVDFDNSQYIGQTNVNYNNENYYENALESAANLQTNSYNNKFIWDRVETRNLYLDRNSKSSTFIKVVTDNPNARIDKLIITDGYNIGQNPNITIANSNQIVIEKQFAMYHHINIGSIIRLAADNKGSAMKISSSGNSIPAGYNWFKVVGYGMSADYEAPIFKQGDIIPDKKNNALVYVDPSQFGLTSAPTQFNNGDLYWNYDISNDKWSKLSSSDSEVYYVGKFSNGSVKNTNLISQYLSSKYNVNYQSNDSLVNLNDNANKTKIINAINSSSKLKDDFNLYPSIMDREKNIKLDIQNIICKTLNINWDSRWNINLFTDSNYSTYFNYIDSSFTNLYIQINQNLLQNETKINDCNFEIKNPFQNKATIYAQNNDNADIKDVVNSAISAMITDKNKPFANFATNNLNVGSGQNIDNLENSVKSKILNYCSTSYSAILDKINSYLNENLSISFSKNLNSIATEISGNLNISIANDKNFEPIIVNKISLNKNGWVYFNDNTNPDNKFAYKLGDSNYEFNSRTDDLEKGMNIFNAFTSIMLIIILIISGVILVLIVKKNIYHMQKQLGVLKAMGYKNSTIIFSYISLPTYLIIFSTALAYPLAILSQYILTLIISDYFNLVFTGINFAFSGVVFAVCVTFLFVFLTIISLLTCWAMLSHPITEVLYNNKKVKVYKFIEVLKRPIAKSTFKVRFSAAMLFKSLDKLVLLSSTLLLTIIIFSSVIIFPFIMSDNKKYSTIDWKYDNLVQYQNPVWNSPYSFYKTYNPTSDANIPLTDDGNSYIKAFSDPNEAALSANYYAYSPELSTSIVGLKLTNLTNKIFSKDFLTKLDESGGFTPGLIISNAWEDYTKIFNVWKNYNSLSDEVKYNTYRNFYNTYKSVALLSINPDFRINQLIKDGYQNISFNNNSINTNLKADNLNINWNNTNFDITDSSQPASKISDSKTLTNDLTIYNDTDFIAYNYNQMNAEKKSTEIKQYLKDFNTLFMSVYYGRLSQAIVGETYGQAPYQLRSQMKANLETPGKDFNLAFNVIPYNPSTDQLGLMFNAAFNNQKFNIYGVDSSSKEQLLDLRNDKNKSIQNLIKNPTGNNDNSYNIIINKSLQKKMDWQSGKEYDLGTYLKQLNIDGNKFDDSNFDTSNLFNATNGDPREIAYSTGKINGQNAYSVNPLNIKPTLSQQWVQNGKMAFATNLKNIKVKVIGIDRSYGEPKAYINNDDAMQIMNYKTSRDFLFSKMFKPEWINNFAQLSEVSTYKELFDKAKSNSDDKKVFQQLLTMFNNEYPIFNYKMSQDKALYDMSSSLSVSNLYGDYSKIGLHGGEAKISGYSSAIYWNSNATPTIYTLITKDAFDSTLDAVNEKVTSFMLALFAFAIGIILIIVIAVSDVIFYENKRVILSMKVLGYNSWDITKSIFGFYLVIAIITFIIGFPLSFYLIKWIISLTTYALPVFLNWEIPLILLTLLIMTFGLIFFVNFNSIKKLKAIQEINNYD